MRRLSPLLWPALALALLACDADGEAPIGPADAGPAADQGPRDQGTADQAPPGDATPPADGGATLDAAAPDGGVDFFACAAALDEVPEFLQRLGCRADFNKLASAPLDASIPGARALKSVIDRFDGDALYFQNTHNYPIHWDFASTHLSGNGLPVVPLLAGFNATEYSSPTRRFLLGTVTHYEGPDLYCYEIAPYDTADAAMITTAFRAIAAHSYFGDRLRFHVNAEPVARAAADLPADVPTITTDALFAGIDYQPLNPAESVGRLRFVTAAELEDTFVSYREIAVLDRVPNDISVTAGIITEQFQTPLSHINVLAKNRGTPNMALRGAFNAPELRALEGQWVRLRVGLDRYEIAPVDAAEAEAWWQANRPEAVQVPGLDLDVRDLRDIRAAVDLEAEPMFDAIKTATR
ncbi:MAG: hypothetical protein KC613_06715, partial [Myxococcales bacterium]|nr:hypothetical protein [Myxococcales bacterium]